MKRYSIEEIESLIARFEEEKLPKVEWTHEAHLVVAIWFCSKYDFETALELVRNKITLHNSSVGTPNTDDEGYHETITKFWLLVAKRFVLGDDLQSIQNAYNQLVDSSSAHSSYPLEYYTKELLFSVEARHNWKEPDLKPIA